MREEKKYDTVVFDLDGTLLNTLEDLADSVNYALGEAGMPLRTLEETRRAVGNGVLRLMELSVPGGRENPRFEETFDAFRTHYSAHCNDKTKVYPGIMELLGKLKDGGYRMAIVSNKYYDAVQGLKRLYFDEYIDVAIGERDGIRKKPAPDTVLAALRALGSQKERSVYVGDSEVDIATANAAGMECIAVGWGFRTVEEQKKAGGKLFAAGPSDMLRMLRED